MSDQSGNTTPEPAMELPSRAQRVLTPVHFFIRGLAISLPAILTVVILLWILSGINTYIVSPTTSAVKWVWAQTLDESIASTELRTIADRPELPFSGKNYMVTRELDETARARRLEGDGVNIDWMVRHLDEVYVPFGNRAVPYADYVVVAETHSQAEMPETATGLYMEVVAERYFKSAFTLSALSVILTVIALYFLGRIVSARVGAWVIGKIETNILGKLPVIRSVYGSVKQVTDFLFSENQVEYRRVVAIEYPRRGIWSLGLVTGESMLSITTSRG